MPGYVKVKNKGTQKKPRFLEGILYGILSVLEAAAKAKEASTRDNREKFKDGVDRQE